MKGFPYNRKDLKNGWDLPANEKIPLTGHKQRLLRAYELLIVKSDEEYLIPKKDDEKHMGEPSAPQPISEEWYRPPRKPEESHEPRQEKPVVSNSIADIPDKVEIADIPDKVETIHAEVVSFRPPGQEAEQEPVLEYAVSPESEEPETPKSMSVTSFRPPGQEAEQEPVLENAVSPESEEPEMPKKMSVTSFRPPGQ